MNLDVKLQIWGYGLTPGAEATLAHQHNYWQINLIDGGRMEVVSGEKTMSVNAGDILIFPPRSLHRFHYLPHGALSQISLKFRLDNPPPELNCEAVHLASSPVTAGIIAQARFAISGFLLPGEWRHTQRELMPPADRRRSVFIEKLIAAILEYHLAAVPDETPGLLARVRHYLATRRGKPVKAAELARHFGYSPGHFSLLLRERTGLTAKAFIDRERTELARHYLEYSDLNIAELAEQLGFRESVYFCEFFKRRTGLSPGAYRRRAGADAGFSPETVIQNAERK